MIYHATSNRKRIASQYKIRDEQICQIKKE